MNLRLLLQASFIVLWFAFMLFGRSSIVHAADSPASTPAIDPATRSKIDNLRARIKSRRESIAPLFYELVDLGEPAQPEVFATLADSYFSNSGFVDYTLEQWNKRNITVADWFRPQAMQMVPDLVAANRREAVQVLSLYGPLRELVPAYTQLSMHFSDSVARPAVDQILRIDPNATDALPIYSLELSKTKSLDRRVYILRALSWIGKPADSLLLKLTRSDNIDTRLGAITSLGHCPTVTAQSNEFKADGIVQPVSPLVLQGAAELLHEPLAGLTDTSRQTRFGGLVVARTLDMLDTYGRAGREVAIQCLAGDAATPEQNRVAVVRSLSDAFPALVDIGIEYHQFSESQWSAVQTLAEAMNQDTPDKSFGKATIRGRGIRTGDITNRLMNPQDGPPKVDAGEHTVAAAVQLLSSDDTDNQLVAAHVLLLAGRLSPSQLNSLLAILKTTSPKVQETLSDAVFSNADFGASPEAGKFVDSLLTGPPTPAVAKAVSAMGASSQGRMFLADRLAADPPLSSDIADQSIAAIAKHQRTGIHAQITQPSLWAQARYRAEISRIFHRFEEDPATAPAETVAMLQSSDATTRNAAATYLATEDLNGFYGPDTCNRVSDAMGISSNGLTATLPVSFSSPLASATGDTTGWLWNATWSFSGVAAFLIAAIALTAMLRSR